MLPNSKNIFVPFDLVYVGKDTKIVKYGEKYTVVNQYFDSYMFKLNNGIIVNCYDKRKFITILEFRKLKLKKLHKKSRNTFPINIIKWVTKKGMKLFV